MDLEGHEGCGHRPMQIGARKEEAPALMVDLGMEWKCGQWKDLQSYSGPPLCPTSIVRSPDQWVTFAALTA